MSCIIWDPGDREFFGGLDVGWTKQLRLARVFPSGNDAAKVIAEWRPTNPVAHRFVILPIWWRIRNADGGEVCGRSSLFDCHELLRKYAAGGYAGWSKGPYRISRVTRHAKAPPSNSEDKS